MTSLLRKSPCDECKDLDTDRCWCEKYEAAIGVIDVAFTAATSIRGHKGIAKLPLKARQTLIAELGDAFDNALYEIGARFDSVEFARRATKGEGS